MSMVFEQNHARLSTAGGNIVNNSNNVILQLPQPKDHKPLPPIQRCPPPSERFTGRREELEKMARFFFCDEMEKHTFIVKGMGGCGKSQLAFKFFHDWVLRNNSKFDPSMVFFLDATTTVTLEDGYKAIAEAKGIGDSSKAAMEWLATTNTPCFLLLDNADDPSLRLRDYLPRSTSASVLITTRLEHAGRKYGSGAGSFIGLQALLETDAEELLVSIAGLEDCDRSSAKVLLQELYCHALAVVQAASGIRMLHLTVDEYITSFRQQRTSLMNGKTDRVTPGDLDDYQWTVETVYRISLSYLHDKPAAMFLLSLFGHMHHTGITEDLFMRAARELNSYDSRLGAPLSEKDESALSALRETLTTFLRPDNSWVSLSFRGCMDDLLSLSLVTHDRLNKYYQLHPLTRDALREDYPDYRPAAFVLWLAHIMDINDVLFNHQISPHSERILSYCDDNTLHPDLAHRLAMTCRYMDHGQRSEVLLRLALDRYPAGGYRLQCLNSLSHLLDSLGRYDDAEKMKLQVLEACTLSLGPDHPGTVLAMANLARTLSNLGRYEEAERMEKQVLEARTSSLGSDHPDTILAMANLARTLADLGRYEEAEAVERKVLEIRTSSLGPDHADTVLAMGNLAATLDSLGRYSDAEKMERQVLETRTSSLGDDHPDTVFAMGNLAATLFSLGRYTDAERLQKQVLEARTSSLGQDHPDTVSAMGNLATTLTSLDRYDDAERMHRQVFEARTSSLGPNHSDTVLAMANLARALANLGHYGEAERMEKQVLEVRTSSLGPDHADTVLAMENLAATLASLHHYDDAQRMQTQVLEARTLSLGQDHPHTVLAMRNLAATLHSLGRYDDAERMERQVLETFTSSLGPDHPHTTQSIATLAVILFSLGRYEEAEKMEKQVLENRTSSLGPDHPDTVTAMGNLAATLNSLGRYDDAERMERQVLEARTSSLGSHHLETVMAMANLATTLDFLGRSDDAERMERQVLEAYTSSLGPHHPDTVTAMANLAITLRKVGQRSEAHQLLVQAVKGGKESLGPCHPSAVRNKSRLDEWTEEDSLQVQACTDGRPNGNTVETPTRTLMPLAPSPPLELPSATRSENGIAVPHDSFREDEQPSLTSSRGASRVRPGRNIFSRLLRR